MIGNDNNLPMLFNTQGEVDFFLEALSRDHLVLEYGAGDSTITIAKHVARVFSIEHDRDWYYRVMNEMVKEGVSEKVHQFLVPRNKEEAPGTDGTLEEYYDYVQHARQFGQIFDVVLVDGRARVECAKVAAELLAPGGVLFIHDYKNPNPKYRRHEYEVVEDFLEEIGGVYALYKFRKKQLA